jgi:hypothetical protein
MVFIKFNGVRQVLLNWSIQKLCHITNCYFIESGPLEFFALACISVPSTDWKKVGADELMKNTENSSSLGNATPGVLSGATNAEFVSNTNSPSFKDQG